MNLRGGLPMLILQNLKAGPNHGYRIAQDIKEKSKGTLDFKEGTLYPTLHTLEGKGLIDSETRRDEGRMRCYYQLTEKGCRTLVKERQEWREMTAAFNMILQEGT